MYLIILGIMLFFFLFIIIDKNKNKQKSQTPQKKQPVKRLTLDQKIKREKTEGIQAVASLITKIEKQKINQLVYGLNRIKQDKMN